MNNPVDKWEAVSLLMGARQEPGEEWFARIAEVLLQQATLLVSGKPHILKEIEFYYHGRNHKDPFCHQDPVQLTCGRWYFHRNKRSYLNGSFKGLDITFGPEDVHGGILIRTIEESGLEINGCSLCVDHILSRTGLKSVGELDARLGATSIWDSSNPLLRLELEEGPRPESILSTARVGLTLKRMDKEPDMPRYILKPYRFVNDTWIRKGKVQTIMGLYRAGHRREFIKSLTGIPIKRFLEYMDVYETGQAEESFESYRGKNLGALELCRMHGTWQNLFGSRE